jgi:glycosyltransferase involved in cell wall biosynthesis
MDKNILNNQPFFSIIIAALNNLEGLRECIETLNHQSFSSYEVLISDGGSSDGTPLFLESGLIRNLSWHKSSSDDGIYHALNLALSHAQGAWVLVLGSDDKLIDNGALERAFSVISTQSSHNVLFYSDLNIRRFGVVNHKRYPSFNEFSRRFSGAPFIHHQSAFVSRDAIFKAGGFDNTKRIHADYDLMLRVLRQGSAFKIHDVFVEYNASGYSSRFKNIARSFYEVYQIRRNLGYRGLTNRIILIYVKLLLVSLIIHFQFFK